MLQPVLTAFSLPQHTKLSTCRLSSILHMRSVTARLWEQAAAYLLTLPASAAGDWLQGPYVYALYQHYGFDRGAIGSLFIAGFGSSMVFGTIVGSLADKT